MEPWSHSFVCQAELLRGGWSLGLINALLGGVDKQAMNPCCRSWAPMRLWLRAVGRRRRYALLRCRRRDGYLSKSFTAMMLAMI